MHCCTASEISTVLALLERPARAQTSQQLWAGYERVPKSSRLSAHSTCKSRNASLRLVPEPQARACRRVRRSGTALTYQVRVHRQHLRGRSKPLASYVDGLCCRSALLPEQPSLDHYTGRWRGRNLGLSRRERHSPAPRRERYFVAARLS